MAKLTASTRSKLPEGQFGVQRTRKHPINAGNLSASEQAAIDTKANRTLQK